ncbi:MAG: diguanylate cyclase [Halofilum sp. (in: g-proteobacteria)]|nr:diguanylate cyclase [Halofilum sp. (in: g-proteobacteria)]
MRDRIEQLLEDRSFEETLVLLCLGLATVAVGIAAMIRALAGSWINAGVDAAIAISTLVLALYVWRTRNYETVGRITAVYCLVVVSGVVHLFGGKMLFWAYPGTIVTFFLLRRPSVALGLNLVALVVILPRTPDLGPWPDVSTFLVTLLTSNLLAMTFADHMHRSRARLRLMAERDALTGARNRYAMDPMLRIALEKVAGHETPASLMVVDLDHFKEVNDTHGHGVGDQVLRRVTQVLINTTRAGDDVFRYGGEELVILANGAAGTPAGQLAEKLRHRIEKLEFDEIDGLTASIGVSEARANDTPHSWFGRADDYMYQAKASGRNRVVVEGDELVQQAINFERESDDD